VVLPPPGAGKRLETPSIEMNFSVMALHGTAEREARVSWPSLRKGHEPGGAREDLVEDHADDTDHQDRGDHVGDRKVVSLVPHEIADAGAADQHFGRHDHQPGDADGDAHSGEDGGCGRGQDDGESTAQEADLERACDVEPLLAYRGDAE